jgi:hypothetical protein
LLGKPIEPVADGFLDNAVTLRECIELIALLSADRRENAFSRLLAFRLLTDLVEFFQSDIVEPTHCVGPPFRSANIFSRPYESLPASLEPRPVSADMGAKRPNPRD